MLNIYMTEIQPMKPILLPNLSHIEPTLDKPSSSGSTGYANHSAKPIKQSVKPAVHLGLIINYSPSAGLSVELVEFHVILITDY